MRSVTFHVVVALVAVVPLASGQSATSPLQVGTPIEQSISGTEVHAFTFRAAANSRVAVVVMQKGGVVSLLGPTGQKLVEVDSPNGANGPEPLRALVEAPGAYRVEVRRLLEPPNPATGLYEIRLETLRAATDAEVRSHLEQKALTDLETQWESAMERADTAALSNLMADDFFYFITGPGGSGKQEQLTAIAEQRKRNADVVETHTINDRTIRIFGDTAVAGGGAVIRMERKEGTAVLPGRFMHVWQKRNGEWKIVADHFYPDGGEPRSRIQTTLSRSDLANLAGTYELVDGTHLTVSAEGDGLVVRQTRPAEQWSIPFVAESATEFFSREGDFQLVFVKNHGAAAADGCHFLMRGRALRGKRVAEAGRTK